MTNQQANEWRPTVFDLRFEAAALDVIIQGLLKLPGELCYDILKGIEQVTKEQTNRNSILPEVVDGIPRRNRLDLMEPAEKSILEAMKEVEKAGADVLLTEATMLLERAKNLVALSIERRKPLIER